MSRMYESPKIKKTEQNYESMTAVPGEMFPCKKKKRISGLFRTFNELVEFLLTRLCYFYSHVPSHYEVCNIRKTFVSTYCKPTYICT